MSTPEPELNVAAAVHKISNALIMDTSVAITQEGTRESKRSQMITRAGEKGEAAILALIQQVSDQRVRSFAANTEQKLRSLPRHRPTNTSLWDGVQMDKAISVIDQTLADYLSHKEK